MKHLKEFRVFSKPEIYSLPQYITTEEDLYLYVNYIANEMGEQVIDILGTGRHGSAFSLKSGKVLKLTQDKDEALIANYLRKKHFYYLVNYYDVRKLVGHKDRYDDDIYAIILDNIIPIKDELENNLDELDFNEIAKGWYLLQKSDLNTTSQSHSKILKREIPMKYFRKNWENIQGILKDCVKLGFRNLPDLHIGNIGKTKDGRLVLFDLSSTVDTKFYKPIRRLDVSPIIEKILELQDIRG